MAHTRIDANTLNHWLADPDVLIVDVRNHFEWISGKIPNARHIPLAQLVTECDNLPTAQKVVFYCQHGIRSQSAAQIAQAHGLEQVYDLADGIVAWIDAGYNLE